MLDAIEKGMNWEQYCHHPLVATNQLATCWACKNAHDTVMTEGKAKIKFKKFADIMVATCARLRHENKTFDHTPTTAFAGKYGARRSTYYWVVDLETEAKLHGWKPRKKRTKRPTGCI